MPRREVAGPEWSEDWSLWMGEVESEAPHPLGAAEAERYTDLGEVGAGGVGEVRLVRDERLGREVAQKVLAQGAEAPQRALDRFGREAWITAQLEHPGIVPLYGAGVREDGSWFYTMRYVRGRSLREALAGCGSLDDRLSLLGHFADVCHAMAYAHSRGVVHRDLKPDNVMVGAFGETQVVDWGLASARGLADDAVRVETVEGADRTVMGAVMGTPSYMSPEQARGEIADARSDVWSLGAILYEILTDERPVPGASVGERLAHLEENAPVAPAHALAPEAPRELSAVAARALRRSRDARYPDAGALAAEIDAWMAGRRVSAYDYRPQELLARLIARYRTPLGVAAIAAVALGALGAWSYREIWQERRAALDAEATSRQHLALMLEEKAAGAAAAGARPEAEVLAAQSLTLDESAEARGVLALFGATGAPRLASSAPLPAECEQAVLAPGGRALACLQAEALSLWDLPAGTERWRQEIETASIGFSPDGAHLFAMGRAGANDVLHSVLRAADGHIARGPDRHYPGGQFAIAPGAPHIVGRFEDVLWVWPAGSSEQTVLEIPCPPENLGGGIAFDSSGELLATSCGDGSLFVAAWRDGAWTRFGAHPAVSHIRFHDDGERLLVGSFRGDSAAIERATGEILQALSGPRSEIRSLTWSPDGRFVLGIDDQDSAWIWSAASGALLTRLPGGAAQSAVFTDAGGLVTLGDEIRTWTLPDRVAPGRFSHGAGLTRAALSPDGALLAAAQGEGEVGVWSVAEGAPRATLRWQDAVVKDVAFSADGERLAGVGIGSPAVHVFETGAFQEIQRLDLMSDRPGVVSSRRVAFADSGRLLIAAPYGLTLGIWSALDGALRSKPELARGRDYRDLYTAPGGGQTVAIDRLGGVYTISAAGETPRYAAASAGAVAVTDDGRLAVASVAGVELVDLETGDARVVDVGELSVLDAALSPDGRWLALGAMDTTIQVWSLPASLAAAATGPPALRAVLRGHDERVASVEFDRSGELLISGSWDGSARIWSARAFDVAPEAALQEASARWGLSVDAVMRADVR